MARAIMSWVGGPAVLGGASLVLCLGLWGCRPKPAAAPPDPYGPVRSVQKIQRDAASLTGRVVRLRGRMTDVRDLNPGMSFPWDVVYTVEDATGSLPVHWLTHEQSPKERRPPVLAGDEVIVTGKVKQDVELGGKRYSVLIHELAELHNQEQPTAPVAPATR